ncbi:unnamed protein product [Effrenium voratum]|uniref:Uncharacterized protein n=1 Tax=Effrenium voratum TaxID=2562239 RepID=A0AA36HVE1_9DINO|nr:unnamed protein product [Effrenium voratum]
MAVPLKMSQFETKLKKAMQQVKLILDAEKTARLPTAEHHAYEDKFRLAERTTALALASHVNCLATLGLSPELLAQARRWASNSQVSLRFKAQESCSFLREETRKEEDPTKRVDEVSVAGMSIGFTSKTVTKVTEFFWKFEVSYQLELFRGVGAEPSDRLTLQQRTGSTEIKTSSKVSPQPEQKIPAISEEANVTFLFKTEAFKIDRDSPKCKTPARNAELKEAAEYMGGFARWLGCAESYLQNLGSEVLAKAQKGVLSTEGILVPALPLMVKGNSEKRATCQSIVLLTEEEHSGPVMSAVDGNLLLEEEARTLATKQQNLLEAVPDGGVFTPTEAYLTVGFSHLKALVVHWAEVQDYIENMLRAQLVAAIGKEVTPADFADYMRFHYRKLFQEAYLPSPFSFAVRRSTLHGPEGTVSIEEQEGIKTPVLSMCSTGQTSHMSFALNASTNVSFAGEVHLHAWLAHQFSGETGAKLSLVSRARQFSSFIVLVGRVTSATSLEPSYAALVQNKDELEIPLDLSTIPTPKEFKDAIESLSPEQQGFAKAFRAMQLESTLFGIVVIQIKPQLEKLLNLPDDSLTKEIKLTQDLMQLFIKYQIPSDLLSFSEDLLQPREVASPERKVQLVKGQVKAMTDMIELEKQQELEERRKEEEFRRLEQEMTRRRLQQAEKEELHMRCLEVEEKKKSGSFFGGLSSMAESMARPFSSAKAVERCAAIPISDAAAASAAPAPVASPGRGDSSAPEPEPAKAEAEVTKDGEPASSQRPGNASIETPKARERDYTQVPQQMDAQFEQLDPDSALRPTIITPGKAWRKRSQAALLAEPKTQPLDPDTQKREKEAAFDLLDAITKSGALPLSHASMHIVVAATHCFDKTVTETVIQDNINPIEKVERSSLIMASTVHQQPAAALINGSQTQRVMGSSPQLFLADKEAL